MKTLTVTLAAVFAVASAAWAGDARVGAIEVKSAWAAPSRVMAKGLGAFMVLTNTGSESDQLVAASAPIAPAASLHDHAGSGHMTPLAAIEVAAGGSVVLKPGALHVMFMHLEPMPAEGASFPLTLRFARAGEVTVTVDVKAMPRMP